MTTTRKFSASDLRTGLRVVMANVCGALRLEGTLYVSEGMWFLETEFGEHLMLTDRTEVVASGIVEIIRTAEEITADRATAVRQIADSLRGTSRSMLRWIAATSPGRDYLPAHGEIGYARQLATRGLIECVRTVETARREIRWYRITDLGREVVAVVGASFASDRVAS